MRVFAHVLARVPVLVVGMSLVVESAFAGSSMMKRERYRRKKAIRRSTDDNTGIIN